MTIILYPSLAITCSWPCETRPWSQDLLVLAYQILSLIYHEMVSSINFSFYVSYILQRRVFHPYLALNKIKTFIYKYSIPFKIYTEKKIKSLETKPNSDKIKEKFGDRKLKLHITVTRGSRQKDRRTTTTLNFPHTRYQCFCSVS